jgi:REP-associated tyrosine transposase
MPRRARFAPAGHTYHVVNRGVERRRLFSEAADYHGFLRLLELGKHRFGVEVQGLCLMPNHFHALLRPGRDRALSSYIHWVQGCYACDLRSRTWTKGNGHVFQQRFWSGAIFDDHHFRNALRYIEANPIEAQLASCAETWEWSSLSMRRRRHRLLDALPITLPPDWNEIVNTPPDPWQTD